MIYATGIRRLRHNKPLDIHFFDLSIRDSDYNHQAITLPKESHDYYTYEPVKLAVSESLLDDPIRSITDAYLKLMLLSRCLVKPHGLNLSGLFDALPVIAWTSTGPVLPDDYPDYQQTCLIKGHNPVVTHVDKFPYLVNYYLPPNVRIASGSQVRLGAYLSPGTTVMPAGFVNFNAGSLGPCMIEGRVSAGVTLGAHTDIGGGASIMGTLSGGNNHVISVGESCLLGANAGIGISLGDHCIVEAGVYITAGKKVLFNNQWVKASTLSGQSNLKFMQHAQTGEIVCYHTTDSISLNPVLHTNAS